MKHKPLRIWRLLLQWKLPFLPQKKPPLLTLPHPLHLLKLLHPLLHPLLLCLKHKQPWIQKLLMLKLLWMLLLLQWKPIWQLT